MTSTFSIATFAEATEYERFVLDTIYPLIARPAAGAVLDVTRRGCRGVAVDLRGFESMAEFPPLGGDGSESESSTVDLRPMVFAAAWKVIDQLIETMVGYPPRSFPKIPQKLADVAAEPPPGPFLSEPALWRRVTATWGSFAEMRNAIMHRRFWINSAADTMNGEGRTPAEPPPAPITLDEVAIFCRAAQGVADAVIGGALSARNRSQLTGLLNQLDKHHRAGHLGGGINVSGPIPIVKTVLEQNLNGAFVLDGIYLHQQAKAGAPQASAFDLLVICGGGRNLVGELEDLPQALTEIDLDDPPMWLRWR